MKATRLLQRFLTAMSLLLLATQVTSGAASSTSAKFGPKWSVIIGEWKGENESGKAAGACGFHFDLSDHVIVRTNHAQLSGNTAVAHDDLMVLHPDADPDKGKAIYFDNEGHVIEYTAAWSADGNTLTLISKPAPGPQFRLIYSKLNAEAFSVTFEMAPPGQQGAFKTYTSGNIRRSGK